MTSTYDRRGGAERRFPGDFVPNFPRPTSGVPLGRLWDASGTPLGRLWGASGAPLGCLWGVSGGPLGCLWGTSGAGVALRPSPAGLLGELGGGLRLRVGAHPAERRLR